MATTETNEESKKAAVNGLAIVGFAGLIIAGIFLAIYAARFVPEALSRLSSAVILSTDNEENPDETPAAPVDEEEEPAEEEPTTGAPQTGGPLLVTPPVAVSPNPPVYSPPVYYPQQPQLYGKADLAITNLEAGYFRGSTFVEDDEVPEGRDAAVRFTVKNNGTNIASGWRVQVEVTGEDDARGNGGSLMPNGTQQFTLRIENPREGRDIDVDIEVDYEDDVDESNERNNERSIELEIEND
jgi:hypothetical protein